MADHPENLNDSLQSDNNKLIEMVAPEFIKPHSPSQVVPSETISPMSTNMMEQPGMVQPDGPPAIKAQKRNTESNDRFKNEYECSEKQMTAFNGALFQLIGYGGFIVSIIGVMVTQTMPGVPIIFGICVPLCLWIAGGVVTVEPNESVVYQLCGKYVGTLRETGLWFVWPFYSQSKVSVKMQNFETSKSTVSDKNGCPIVIQAIVVWKIADTAKSSFAVENVYEFVSIQSESALRQFVALYPYDSNTPDEVSLMKSGDIVNAALKDEIDARLEIAGIDVTEARISNLEYAPVVAQSMLRRQQAGAVLAARTHIVMGAVLMCKAAIEQMEATGLDDITDEQKANMVCTMMILLCSDDGSSG